MQSITVGLFFREGWVVACSVHVWYGRMWWVRGLRYGALVGCGYLGLGDGGLRFGLWTAQVPRLGFQVCLFGGFLL